jgi:phenylacetate-CoA ligase
MKEKQKIKSQKIVEYWETERLPSMHKTSSEFRQNLLLSYNPEVIKSLYEAPFLPFELVERYQFERIKNLITLAYEKITVYRKKYQKEGFEPGDLKSWNDYNLLPVITKDELIAAFPEQCVNPDYDINDLFPTRSSGSSGKTLRIYVDPQAIITDTLQGIRQFWLQSGGGYNKDKVIAHVYTVPWWVDSLGNGDYQSIFISSLINPQEIAEILKEVKPDILSLYPTNLQSIIPFLSNEVIERLRLVVVHSEMSSKKERENLSEKLGRIPVLDEYSSEELTRIALELPCNHYHLCEDTVRVDIVDPKTKKPISKGTGLVVGTNLLNTAMPFIRYVQGDLVTIEEQQQCGISWRQIEKIEGRQNDAFLKKDGSTVPAGTILDISYRWMFDTGVNIQEFEIVQTSPTTFRVTLKEENLLKDPEKRQKSSEHLYKLLSGIFGEDIIIDFSITDKFPSKSQQKRRPIRREF